MASSSRSSSTLIPDDPADMKTRVAAGSAEWRPKHYVLAGMAVILAASTVTIVTSVVLRPALIHFSVANFTMSNASNAELAFDFNLSAFKPSRRAEVIYHYVVVSMQLQRHGTPSVRKISVPGMVHLPLYQGKSTNSSIIIGVNGTIDNDFFDIYSWNASPVSTTIMVNAQVQFKVGVVKSRRYSIRVLCSSIDNLGIQMPPGNATCSA